MSAQLPAAQRLSGDWRNTFDPLDANLDGKVTPLDALAIINYLNSTSGQGSSAGAAGSIQQAGQAAQGQAPRLDANGDGHISPLER